jgi:hypothetical protein
VVFLEGCLGGVELLKRVVQFRAMPEIEPHFHFIASEASIHISLHSIFNNHNLRRFQRQAVVNLQFILDKV